MLDQLTRASHSTGRAPGRAISSGPWWPESKEEALAPGKGMPWSLMTMIIVSSARPAASRACIARPKPRSSREIAW